MAKPRVFVSSTCYDLGAIRSELRDFIISLGYEPVMSDYTDILYDPDKHTHDSCVKQIKDCDLVVLIIGSRFGGIANHTSFASLNINMLSKMSSNGENYFNNANKHSITQVEVLKAIENRIPIYSFVDAKVRHEQHIYEINKDKGNDTEKIFFPSIDKQKTAKYIFDFISFLGHLDHNNSLYDFTNISDVKSQLINQWSAYFKELLLNRKDYIQNSEIDQELARRFDDLKEAILITIDNKDKKSKIRSIAEYRSLISFILSFDLDESKAALLREESWDGLLRSLGVIDIKEEEIGKGGRPKVVLIRDSDYYRCNYSWSFIRSMKEMWGKFVNIDRELKSEIIESISVDEIKSFSPLKKFDGKYKSKQIN